MITPQTIEAIARVAHETNRAYCATQGDGSQSAWNEAPEWQRTSAINGVKFHLEAHDNGDIPNPAASHESWLAEKEAAGWRYGPVKDETLKQHPCYVPYEDLPAEQRVKDYLFGHVVAAFVEAAA